MTSNNSNMANQNQNQNIKKEELYKWIEESNLYGTWTFTTQTMTDIGYYKGISYFVIHIMPNPMSGVNSCEMIGDNNNCTEADNYACHYNNERKKECINTETSQVDWSDVTIFFQYGFRLRTGIVHKTYHNVNTGGNWLGPYNIILAQVDNDKEEDNDYEKDETEEQAVFVSRYVNTPWTKSQLQRPFQNANIFEYNSHILENLIGTKVINTTIQKVQKTWNGHRNNNGKLNSGTGTGASASSIATQRQRRRRRRRGLLRQDEDSTTITNDAIDPYSKYLQNCDHGDIQPILPRLQLKRTVDKASTISYSMSIDYSILSVPEKGGINNDLYKLWPTMKKHLGTTFPLYGPYCYGKDPNRAYAIRLSFDSEIGNNNSTSSSSPPPLWSGVKGCVPPWPCWNGEPYGPPSPSPSSPTNKIPNGNGTTGKYVLDPLSITALILYLLGSLLVISSIFNWLLSNRLLKQQQQLLQQQQQQQDSVSSPQPPPPSGDEEQEIGRRYDYLEEVVGGNTTSGNGNGNGNDRDGDNNDNNTSNLNDSLEEPLLPSSSSTFNSHNKNNNNAEESFSDYYRNEEEGKNEATATATSSTNLSTSAPPSGVDESKQES